MEIHELNTFSGTLGSSDYFATDNGNDTSKVSAADMFAPLNTRIDNIIAGGDAPSAAEVIDARLGATELGSVQYASLGDAIRGQASLLYGGISDVKKDLSEYRNGILAPRLVSNSYVTVQGDISSYNGWSRTDYLDCGLYDKLLINNGGTTSGFNCFYNESKGFISAFTLRQGNNTISVPANAKYFICSNNDASMAVLTIKTQQKVINDELFSKVSSIESAVALAPTGDTTDMSSVINARLQSDGFCALAPGTFYVSGIEMPAHSEIKGCGEGTIIRLLDNVTSGIAIKMSSYCSVSDVAISGNDSDIDADPIGGRTGIGFIGNYDGTDEGETYQTDHCMISNVWIRSFSGSGIQCHNTSINYAKGLYVENAFIYNCHIGINIDYYSEFNKFTNVCVAWCWYACVNNGGNNVFTACTFHATNTGFYIDGSKPNTGHGILNGCTFCHIGSNTGRAINMVSVPFGFVISNCQFWYNSIRVVGSKSIVFSGCEFGNGTTGLGMNISISGGALVLFSGCVFHNDVAKPPQITIENNTKTHFDSCYGGESGNAITA